jgi:uncharacterized membrane protein YkvA (DUF1232 family)
MCVLAEWRAKAKALKREVAAVAIAARDPRTPTLARILMLGVVAYAVSPIDLIPDFIPVLGMLDDLLLLPAAMALAISLIPPEVMADARARAGGQRLVPSRTAAALIIVLWGAAALACLYYAWPLINGPTG